MTSPKRYLIIGGVAGGMSAATRLRRLDETAEIIVFERSGHVSFANCGLPYHLGGIIKERSSLLLQTPRSLGRRFALDVRVRHEVVAIDAAAKTVTVLDLDSGQRHTERYDALVLSPGSTPFRLDVPGAERLLTLRDIEDVDAAMAALQAEPETALVIGAGFIGLEMVENLLHRGLRVTVVERGSQVLPPLDPEMAGPVADRLREAGVDVRLGVEVVALDDTTATLSDGTTVPAEFALASIGVRPETTLASTAGLALGERGGIRVDDQQRTSDPHIWAVGDAVEKTDAVSGEHRPVALAGLANRHGRLAADSITGARITVKPALGTAIVGLLGLHIATVGWNETLLRARGRDIRVFHTHPSSHAGYYPGAEGMSLKLIADAETDAILGAQAIGGEGVDKRIDVIATAMGAGLTASDLADLELAYSPQHSSAKDPVNMLGYVALNHREGQVRSIQWHELAAAIAEGATLVDVRTKDEHAAGSIPGSLLLPVDELRRRHADLPAGPIIVHCAVGQRGHTAARLLTQLGRDVVNLDGGYRTWRAGVDATVPGAAALAA